MRVENSNIVIQTCLVYFIHRVVQFELITLSEKDFFLLNIDHIDYSASGNMYFPYSIDLSTGTAGGMARLKTEVNGPCFFFSVLAGI